MALKARRYFDEEIREWAPWPPLTRHWASRRPPTVATLRPYEGPARLSCGPGAPTLARVRPGVADRRNGDRHHLYPLACGRGADHVASGAPRRRERLGANRHFRRAHHCAHCLWASDSEELAPSTAGALAQRTRRAHGWRPRRADGFCQWRRLNEDQ